MSSPQSATTKASPGGSRIGRPPQWTISRSRKLARLYVYTTLSIERIIKVLEDDVFKPRKNSAQKTIHKMLDNDPRYLRPDSRAEMDLRISSLSASVTRRRRRRTTPVPASSTRRSGSDSIRSPEDTSSFGFSSSASLIPGSPSQGITLGTRRLSIRPPEPESVDPLEFSTTSSSIVQDLQRRMSDCSSNYARQISTLLRDFSISSASELDDEWTSDRRPSAASSLLLESAHDPDSSYEAFEAFPEPGFALPGDFLNSFIRSCADFPGQEHGNGRCWCAITNNTLSTENSWLSPTGDLSERAQSLLRSPHPATNSLRDCFGNTPLHLFAALQGYQDTLFQFVLNNNNIDATNNASQTFLHVLNVEWFSDLDSPSARLHQLLAVIHDSAPGLVYATDVYGRNFFHRAHSLIHNPALLTQLLAPFNPSLASRRDAFGFTPTLSSTDSNTTNPFIPPRRTASQSPPYDTTDPKPTPGSPADESLFLAYHARLVQTIQSSYTDPQIQDSSGRNGLHCLAEAILNPQTMEEQRFAMTTGRPMKRKLQGDIAAAPAAQSTTSTTTTPNINPILSMSPTAGPNQSEGLLPARLRHLEHLLHSPQPVDINAYDSAGTPVLTAFIAHIPDDQDDKAKTLLTILETLLRAGARIEARNRAGETALLVAARLGRKVALTTLLEHGANVHARDVFGRGVLEVVDATCRGAGGDVALYARLEACRVLLTGRRDWGVVASAATAGVPPVVLEWRGRVE
ncbi:hypothetical protein B0T22DRAFT_411382 [Podospora appendiculata]|uniref:Ankyrin n=1 Tax=Podospora appendiculata TaxID=314037 RepID=A0AAE0X2B5_9PEZI|nr:hypothetical protein B0T22DRAFT_411382 [Podospora appendiculata]